MPAEDAEGHGEHHKPFLSAEDAEGHEEHLNTFLCAEDAEGPENTFAGVTPGRDLTIGESSSDGSVLAVKGRNEMTRLFGMDPAKGEGDSRQIFIPYNMFYTK